MSVPEEWTCDESFFNDGFSCDCECGVVDPDCSVETAPIFNCAVLEVCNATGQCDGGLEDIPVPETWTCNPAFFNVNDGCDCECGAFDPDCNLPGTLFNCLNDGSQECSAEGFCVDLPAAPTVEPFDTEITQFPTVSPILSPSAGPGSSPTIGDSPTMGDSPGTGIDQIEGLLTSTLILALIALVLFFVAIFELMVRKRTTQE